MTSQSLFEFRSFFTVALLCLFTTSAPAQDAWNVELVGHIGGLCAAVLVDGNYAYVGEGPALRILDMGDPLNPQPLGSATLPGIVQGIYVRGAYAYVAASTSGLRVINISDPARPFEVGGYNTNDAWDVYVSGDFAYVADEVSGLRLIDISNPRCPFEVGHYSYGNIHAVCVSGNFAYVADWNFGLRIIDVSDPSAPFETGSYATPGKPEGIYVCGDYAYVAGGGLSVINIEDPFSPFESGYCSGGGHADDVHVSGNYAYVAGGWFGEFLIIDITNPSAPFIVGNCYTPEGFSLGVDVSGNYAYLADGGLGLRIIDVSDPNAPFEAGYCGTPGAARGVHVSGNYAYVACERGGLRIINISDPSAPFEAGCYIAFGLDDAWGVYTRGSYAYVASQEFGLRVIDVSNPSAPFEAGHYNTPGLAWDVFVSGNYAYVADGYRGLRIMDISSPTTPTEVGCYDWLDMAFGVFVSGNYAYIADGLYGLRVIDVSNPTAPFEAGRYDTAHIAERVYYSGNYAYVADFDGGLFILGFVGTPVASYEFSSDRDGWTTGTAEMAFAAPEFEWQADWLKIRSTSTNSFGYWRSPAQVLPVDAGYLYRARFRVASDVTAQSRVPTVRLRVNASNDQQADCLTIESAGDGAASPVPSGRSYDLYFVPPANAASAELAFDLLNFDPTDAADAELALDSVVVHRFALDTLSTPTIVRDYDFDAGSDGWSTGTQAFVFTPPLFSSQLSTIQLSTLNNTNTFGFWESAASDIITSTTPLLYRGTFEVRTDVTDRTRVPQMRLRFNTANMQASRTMSIESVGDGANSPGTTNTTYDNLYFLPPANCVGDGLIVSFDMLNFSPDDAPTGSLILDGATIEALTPPSSP